MSSIEGFIAKAREKGISPGIASWLFFQIGRFSDGEPDLGAENTLADEDVLDLLVAGAIEVCLFRPTTAELEEAWKGLSFKTFLDYALTISNLEKHRPNIENKVWKVCCQNRSEQTQELWRVLCLPNQGNYDDQFVISCYINPSLLNRLGSPSNWAERLCNTLGKKFSWLNGFGIEIDLKRRGYSFEPSSTLSGTHVSAGDVIKVKKNLEGDKFVLFALVSKTSDGVIEYVDFKPDGGPALQATLEGFELFFLRDPHSKVEGIWKSKIAPLGT